MSSGDCSVRSKSRNIAVLGGGLQGSCIAMELAARGARVDLYERNSVCVAEASENNEGKVHLGYVYANDVSFETARLMATGGLSFERLMRRWVGARLDRLCVSAPFHYVVHRESLISPDQFATHARKVAAFVSEQATDEVACYFGRDPKRLPERVPDAEIPPGYRPETVAAVFRTEEISIDPVALAEIVRTGLDEEPDIQCLTEREVLSVEEGPSHVVVRSTRHGGEDTQGYDYVVNTLWSSRLLIDLQLGLEAPQPWSFRFKYFIRARLARDANLASTTIVLGPFGDIVNYPGRLMYLSWYPAGMTTWSTDVVPPRLPASLQGAQAQAVQGGILRGLAEVAPNIAALEFIEAQIRGGWIYALGSTDIGDPNSNLHKRSDIGVRGRGRYISVDTGKLTTAPMFAAMAARRICAA
jgi:FAD dependent oxidoreductase